MLSMDPTKLVKPGTMFPEAPYPLLCISGSSENLTETTQILPLLLNSYNHIAVFFIGDLALHEPHPLFLRFVNLCKRFNSLRSAIVARLHRFGGLRKPEWAEDDILFLAASSTKTEMGYGLNGIREMGLVIIRPDGYVAYSTLVDASGNTFRTTQSWLEQYLL